MAWFMSGGSAIRFSSRDWQALKKKITTTTSASGFAMVEIITAS